MNEEPFAKKPFKVFRSNLAIEDEGKYITGARFINDVGNVTLQYVQIFRYFQRKCIPLCISFVHRSIAACVRFKFKYLGKSYGKVPNKFFLLNMFLETRFSLFRKPFQGHTVSI